LTPARSCFTIGHESPTLDVKQGNSAFQIRGTGLRADQVRQAAQTLAKQVLTKL
jgi:hypothetical protein